MEPGEPDRLALAREREQAQRTIGRGVAILLPIILIVLFGGLLAIVLDGVAELVAMVVMLLGAGTCAATGSFYILRGVRRDERARRLLDRLERPQLPEARVVR